VSKRAQNKAASTNGWASKYCLVLGLETIRNKLQKIAKRRKRREEILVTQVKEVLGKPPRCLYAA
jgi:hypothetical protein